MNRCHFFSINYLEIRFLFNVVTFFFFYLLLDLKGLFNRNNVSTAKDRSASLAVFSRRLNGADLSTIERSFVPMLENNFGSDVFEDDIFYLEASDSIEGPPAKRIYERLNWRVCNLINNILFNSNILLLVYYLNFYVLL